MTSSGTVRPRAASASAAARVIVLAAASMGVAAMVVSAFAACGNDVNLGGSSDAATDTAAPLGPTLEDLGDICEPCTTAATCPAGANCVQISGNLLYCATACPNGNECESDETCQMLASGPGAVALPSCAPKAGTCASAPPPASESAPIEHCGTLESPSTVAACRSCDQDDRDCQPNGCYAGWWCNTTTNRCRKPPAVCP